MSKGNYSCNRAVIFESAIILLLSLFWNNHNHLLHNHLLHNRISTTTPSPPQRQPQQPQTPSPQPPTSPQTTASPTNNISATQRDGYSTRKKTERTVKKKPLLRRKTATTLLGFFPRAPRREGRSAGAIKGRAETPRSWSGFGAVLRRQSGGGS